MTDAPVPRPVNRYVADRYVAGRHAGDRDGTDGRADAPAASARVAGSRLPVPYVAAHRGASRLAPENTLAAFSAALAQGAKAIELDVHLSRDERAVVIHDDTVDRTTNGSGPVSGLDSSEVKQLDAGSWWSPGFKGEPVPFLEEAIALTEGRAVLHVELKGARANLLAGQVVKMVRQLEATERVVVMSFDLDAVLAAREAGPGLIVLPIISKPLDDQLSFALATGVSGLNQAVSRWDATTVRRFHERGLLAHGSLVNDVQELDAFFRRGGDVVDSDSPECFAAHNP
jgi:glycerophosphoryl diester phosphodiesterase